MTWTQDAIEAELLRLFGQHKHTDAEVAVTSEIVADLGLDSLGVMEVLADIEDKFKLTIPDEALRDITTVGDVAGAIVTRLQGDGRLSA